MHFINNYIKIKYLYFASNKYSENGMKNRSICGN